MSRDDDEDSEDDDDNSEDDDSEGDDEDSEDDSEDNSEDDDDYLRYGSNIDACRRGNSYQARPPVGGWGNPWDCAGSRAAPNIGNKEPRTKQAGTRRGKTPRAVRRARRGVGEGRRDLHDGMFPVAAPIATEGDGPRNPETLFKQFTCEGPLGACSAALDWSGFACCGTPLPVVQRVGPGRGATPRLGAEDVSALGPIGQTRNKDRGTKGGR